MKTNEITAVIKDTDTKKSIADYPVRKLDEDKYQRCGVFAVKKEGEYSPSILRAGVVLMSILSVLKAMGGTLKLSFAYYVEGKGDDKVVYRSERALGWIVQGLNAMSFRHFVKNSVDAGVMDEDRGKVLIAAGRYLERIFKRNGIDPEASQTYSGWISGGSISLHGKADDLVSFNAEEVLGYIDVEAEVVEAGKALPAPESTETVPDATTDDIAEVVAAATAAKAEAEADEVSSD